MTELNASAAARFLHERYGGSSPRAAMSAAIASLINQVPINVPSRPSAYAQYCRTNPLPEFALIPTEGALRLREGIFQVIIRDAVSNPTLPFVQDEVFTAVEAMRQDRGASVQLAFSFDDKQENNLRRRVQVPAQSDSDVEHQTDINLPPYIMYRQRFTYAHELCHTLFFDLAAPIPNRPYPYRRGIADSFEESLCNFGAGLLLMPEEAVSGFLQQRLLDPGMIGQFCTLFKVSLQAAVVRLAQYPGAVAHDRIIVLSKYSDNRFTGRDKKLRVRACILPPSLRSKLFLPENIGVGRLGLKSAESFFASRFTSDATLSAPFVEDFGYGGLACRVETIHECLPDYNSVVISYLRIL
jgi:hypothetical protein